MKDLLKYISACPSMVPPSKLYHLCSEFFCLESLENIQTVGMSGKDSALLAGIVRVVGQLCGERRESISSSSLVAQ